MRPGLPIDPRDSGDPSLEDHLGAALRDDDDELGTTRDEPPPRARSSTHSEPTRDELGTTRDEPVPDMVIPRQLTRPSSANAAAAPRREPPNLGPASSLSGSSMTRLEPPRLPTSAPVTRPATLPPGIRLEPPNLPPPSGISHRDPGRDPDPVSADLTLRDPPNLPPASGITRRDVGRDPPPSGITRRDPPPARLAVSGEIADEIASTHADALGLTRDSSQRLRPLLAATATPSNRDIDTTAADRSSNLGATLAAPPSKDAPIPRQIGRYAVLRRLGRGGMGTVYAAYDEQLTRRVAIKILHAGIETGDRAPLVAEARAMAQLSHPNVVQVYELGEHDHHDFLAMEYVEGRTLGDWLTADRPPWQLVLRRFIAAGAGLPAAHRAGLVHRDFKPDNVLLGADEVPRVADFGLARPSAEGVAQIAGTPAYMSPEQHEGTATDARSDQFSFCVALHEALYGRPPFAGDTYVDRATNVLAGDLQPPPTHGPVPRGLYTALVVGLARDPAARYPTMDLLLAELRRFLPRPRPTALYVSLAALAASTLLVLVVLLGRTPPPGASPAAAARIAHHAVAARSAAAEAAWIYPLPDSKTPTAIHEINALEAIPAPASELARKQSERLRDHFAKQLAALGQRYWDAPKTRPFARDFYAQTLMFRPQHEQALQRGNFTMGQLAQLRDEAEHSGFTPEQLTAVAPLRILADPDDPRLAALLASLPAACDAPISQQDPARGSGLLAPPPEPAPPPVPTETIAPPSDPEPAPEPAARPTPRRPAFDPSALIEEAENARRRGQDDEAAKLFREALAGAPREATALAALSDIAFDRGDFQEAADFATQAVRAAPTIGEHHTRLGDAYTKLKRTTDARAQYQRALDLGDSRARRRLDIDAPKP